MGIEVKIIEDSINPYNDARLTTFQLRYHRYCHSEFMTHRVFSRNASSSRAIPTSKMLKQVWSDPATPVSWGANNPGMQSKAELKGFKRWITRHAWTFSGKLMCCFVWTLNKIASPHKQIINRLLEPWQYISVVVTATDWDNFWSLRCHPDAQPEFQELANEMKVHYDNSVPVKRVYHLPYITNKERDLYDYKFLAKLSTARCARVSYLTHDGKNPDSNKDLDLHNKLVASEPIHASPTEHPALAIIDSIYVKNFLGWYQYRVDVENGFKYDEELDGDFTEHRA